MKSFIHSFAKAPFSFIFCLLFSISLWLVFYPGVYSIDSMIFVYQATIGKYYDFQPVLISFLIGIVLRMGGNLSLLTLVQALAGMFGLRQLVLEVGRLFKINNNRRPDALAFAILLLLSSPLTLVPIFLVTLWTDTWLAIFLVWAIATLTNIYQESRNPDRILFYLKISCLVGLLGLAMLVRYNALVLIPVAVLVIERATAHFAVNPRLRLPIAFAPLAMIVLFSAAQSRFLNIVREHDEHFVYALDLASMILRDPSVCHDLSLNSCDMVQGLFPKEFVVGNGAIDNTINQGRGTFSKDYLDLVRYPGLVAEYIREINDHPLLWVSVKVSNYLDYLRPDTSRFFYPELIPNNNIGLAYDPARSVGRTTWFSISDWVSQNPVLRWFSFVHSFWLIMNLLELGVCLFWMAGKHNKDAAFLALILTIPLVYYGSYLLALTASDFRFMYPSTLIIQVISLTILFSLLLRPAKP
jgi:hypothetical protein